MLIKSLKDFFIWLKRDLIQRSALKKNEKLITLRLIKIFYDPINLFMLFLRLKEWSINVNAVAPVKILISILFKLISVLLNYSIPPNVFGPGLAIIHYGPIVVNGNAKVGENCRLHVSVNIGGTGYLTTKVKSKNLSPIIGSNVYIGPNTVITGPIKIADNSVIGAHSLVNKSFEENGSVIVGVPAKVISKKGSNGMIL